MHVGFIMDGNRRWATGKGMIKVLGHTKGTDNVENVLEMCLKEGVEFVSMWVIAKKNLEERSKTELEHLFELISTYRSRKEFSPFSPARAGHMFYDFWYKYFIFLFCILFI